MSRIFISYRRDETSAWAFMVNERLAERFGPDKVFMDIDSIEPGDDFVEVIKSKVGACEVLVVLIGRAWLTCTDESGRRRLDNHDDFVRLEVKAALERGIRVIPVLVSGARPPRPEEVPDDLSPLCHRNALTLTEVGYRQDLGRLVDIVAKAIGLPEPAAPGKAAPQPKRAATTPKAPKPKPAKIVGEERIFRDHGKPVKAVAFSPDGTILASAGGGSWLGGGDTAIRLWRLSDGRLIKKMEGHTQTVTLIAFSPAGDLLASRCSVALHVWRTKTAKRMRTLKVDSIHDGFAFSDDGARLVTWTDDKAAPGDAPYELWSVANGQKMGTYSRSRLPGRAGFRWGHLSPDRKLTTSVQDITVEDSDFSAIVVKQAAGGATLFELNDDGADVNDWRFSGDGQLIAAAYNNNTVRIWRVTDGKHLAAIDLPAVPNGIAISLDNRWLAAACEDKLVRVWPLSVPVPYAP
jgi:hypothetical protein